MGVPISRREVLRGTMLAAAGAGAVEVGDTLLSHWWGWDRPPVTGGYAAAADNLTAVTQPEVSVRYYVETTEPVVAFTFDDGPGPHWTPMVLDALEQAGVPVDLHLYAGQDHFFDQEPQFSAAVADAMARFMARYAPVQAAVTTV